MRILHGIQVQRSVSLLAQANGVVLMVVAGVAGSAQPGQHVMQAYAGPPAGAEHVLADTRSTMDADAVSHPQASQSARFLVSRIWWNAPP